MSVVGDAFVRVRTFSAGLGDDIRNDVRRGLGDLGPDFDREGDRLGRRFSQRMRRGMEDDNRRGGTSSLFDRFGSEAASKFGDAFNLGIGKARMGTGLISVLVAAGPGMISAAASIATALAAEILTAMSAIGPGLIGLGGAIGAGLATAVLNAGLLYAAFKSGVEGLSQLKTDAGALAKELGTPVAQGMIGGMQEAVATLRGALPQLNDLLHTTGQKFGDIAKNAAATIVSSENMGKLRSILETNNTFLDNFGVGLNNLISAFLTLFAAAKPFIDYLGQGLVKFSDWLKTILDAKSASGELTAEAQRYLDRWKELWQTIKDFGAGILNLFKGISPVGASLADSMASVAAKFKEWTGDEANQAKITAFFEKAHLLSSKIFEVLGKLFEVGGKAFMNADFTNLFAVMDSIANKLGPAIAEIFNQIQTAMGPHLVQIVDNIGTAFQKIADSGAIGVISDLVGTLLEKVSQLAATDLGSWVLAAGVAWALFGGIIQPIASLLFGIVGALGAVGAAVAAAVGFFVLMYQNSQSLRDAIGHLVEIVGGKFTEIWDKVGPKVLELWDAITRLAGVIGDRLAPVIEAIAPVIGDVFSFLGDAFAGVLDIAKNLINFIADVFSGDWEAAWNDIKSLFAGVWDTIKNLLGDALKFIVDLFTGWWGLVVQIWEFLWGKVSDIATNVWNNIFDFFNNILTNIADAIRSFGNAIQDGWNAALNWLRDTAVNVWNSIFDFFNTILSNIADGIRAAGTAIQDAWNATLTWLHDTAVTVWNAILDALNVAWNAILVAFHFVFDPWVDFFSMLWTNIQSGAAAAWAAIQAGLSAAWAAIVAAVHFLFDPWVDFFSQLWSNITSGAVAAWNGIMSFLSSAWDAITSTVHSVWDAIVSFLSSVWNGIASTASAVWGGIIGIASSIWNAITRSISDIVSNLADILSGWWDTISGAVSSAWNGLEGIVSGIWEGIKSAIVQPIIDAWNQVTKWISDIKDAVSGAIDWLTGKVSEATDKLNSILDKQAEAGLVGVGVTPGTTGAFGVGGGTLAEGGIVPPIPGGWFVNVAEAGRSERIEPLDSQGLSRRDRALISHIVSQMAVSSTGGGSTQVQIFLDGRQLTGVVAGVVSGQIDDQARSIKQRRRRSA